MGEPTTNLKVRIKTIRDGYAELCNKAQEAIYEEVATRLYAKVHDSFPPYYQEAMALPAKIEEQIVPIRERYISAKTKYGIRIRNIETTLDKVSSRIKTVSSLKADSEITGQVKTKKIHFADPDPRQISHRRIDDAKTAINQYRNRLRSRAITLLRIEGAKKVASQFPKVFTSQIKTALFRQLTQAYPILEPVIDVFSGTIDKEIENEVEKTVDRVANSLIQNSKNIEKVIDQEASRIVDQKTVNISSPTLRKAKRARTQLEKEFASIEKAEVQIERAIKQNENRRIAKLISQLRSSNEEVRVKASGQLSRMGEKLSKSQVNNIINIMKNGKETWSKFLYRESHCSWYEDTTVKYYAGRALENMRSQYVSNEIAREARNAQNNAKTRRRVTDPGWI